MTVPATPTPTSRTGLLPGYLLSSALVGAGWVAQMAYEGFCTYAPGKTPEALACVAQRRAELLQPTMLLLLVAMLLPVVYVHVRRRHPPETSPRIRAMELAITWTRRSLAIAACAAVAFTVVRALAGH